MAKSAAQLFYGPVLVLNTFKYSKIFPSFNSLMNHMKTLPRALSGMAADSKAR